MGDTAELLLQLRAAALVEQEAYKQEGATYLSPNTTICGRAATTIEETMQMLLERDKRISALEEAQRWIPVSERLPEEGQNVFAKNNSGAVWEVVFYRGSPLRTMNKWTPAPPEAI